MERTLDMIFAGFGGQGILFAGKLVAYAGLIEDREVSWLPSYGPEMRGGTANCSVCLSDEPIGSPLVLKPNILVAMNQVSFDKFKDSVKPGGIIIVDSTMVHEIPSLAEVEVHALPATHKAEEEGLKGLANMICVGKLFAVTHFCEEASLFASVEKCVSARKQNLLESNKKALLMGMEA